MIVKIFNQKYKLLALSSIILLGVFIYSNTFKGAFHFDDVPSIVDNQAIRSIWNLQAIWDFWPTRFITYFSMAFNYHLSQLNVFSYHFFNLIVHLITSILVWWFVLLIFSTPVMVGQKIAKRAKLVALFAALFFVAHPIQTQGVTYIIQRATSLATLFYLLSISLYVKSRLLQQQEKALIVSRLFYCTSLIALVMAMFTKEIAISLPLTILLCEVCFLKTKKWINLKYLAPFFITILIIPFTMFLTKSVDFIGMRRALEPTIRISSWQYLFTQFRVIVTYLRLLFMPINQNLIYDYPITKSLLELSTLASLIFLIIILTIAVRIFSKYRLISFCIFWFFLTLLPESSIIPINDVIYEHRLYLPMVGFSLFLVSLVYYIFENRALKSMVIALLIITSSYAVITYRRNFVWKDELTLWNDVMYKSPGEPRPYNGRGKVYYELGNILEAFSDFNRAIEIKPDYVEAYNNRGIIYKKRGDLKQALSDFNKAIEINPGYEKAYNNRGAIYYEQNNIAQASSDYSRAIEINPNFAEAYYNRGVVYYEQGNLLQATSDFTRAIEINPNFADAYSNRGNIYLGRGEFTQAIYDYTKAIKINPNLAKVYNNRSNAYTQQGKILEALSDCTKAIEIDPNLAEVYLNRGLSYVDQGSFAQAISDFTKAIEIKPSFTDAYYNRSVVYCYSLKEYNKAWADVHKLKELGYIVDPKFIVDLKKLSGKNT